MSQENLDRKVHMTQKSISNELCFCTHTNQVKHNDKSYCKKCGIMNSPCQAFKSHKFTYGAFIDPQLVRNAQLRDRLSPPNFELNKDYQKGRNQLIDFMLESSSRLKFSFNTLHLGILFLDHYMSKNIRAEGEFQVYAATALMLASKAQELDMKIPFISKLKRYTKLENPTVEFKRAEVAILKHLDWNLQCCTLVDHMETLISIGVVFSTDTISIESLQEFGIQLSSKHTNKKGVNLSLLNEQEIIEIFHRIEKDYLRVANLIVRDMYFSQWSESTKALACLIYLRKLCGLSPVCPKQLQELVQDGNEIINLFEQFVIQLDPIFSLNSVPQTQNPNNRIHQSVKRIPLGPCNNLGKLAQSEEEIRKSVQIQVNMYNKYCKKKEPGTCELDKQIASDQVWCIQKMIFLN